MPITKTIIPEFPFLEKKEIEDNLENPHSVTKDELESLILHLPIEQLYALTSKINNGRSYGTVGSFSNKLMKLPKKELANLIKDFKYNDINRFLYFCDAQCLIIDSTAPDYKILTAIRNIPPTLLKDIFLKEFEWSTPRPNGDSLYEWHEWTKDQPWLYIRIALDSYAKKNGLLIVNKGHSDV